MRYLITGGAGFIGSHLSDALVGRGDEALILDDLSTGSRKNVEHLLEGRDSRAGLIEGSVLDADLVDDCMASVDRCFHLASTVGVKLVVDAPLQCLQRIVRGADVVTAAAARHDRRLLFTSTSEIYGKLQDDAVREDSDRLLGAPSVARWNYATAKAFGEALAFGHHREQGAEMVVARLFNTVGPRQTGVYGMVLPRFVQQALAGEDLTVYGDGAQRRCFTHVRDTVDALERLIDCSEAAGAVFNVGSSVPISIVDLARKVIERTGSDSSIRLVPYEEAFAEGFEELGFRRPDTSAISRLVGWEAAHPIERAVDDVIDYERASQALGAGQDADGLRVGVGEADHVAG